MRSTAQRGLYKRIEQAFCHFTIQIRFPALSANKCRDMLKNNGHLNMEERQALKPLSPKFPGQVALTVFL